MNSTLSERIRIILETEGLKQAELASSLGVSTNYISLLAGGRKTKISLTLAKLIEALYGYDARWIMTGDIDRSNSELLRRFVLYRVKNMDAAQLLQLEKFIMEI